MKIYAPVEHHIKYRNDNIFLASWKKKNFFTTFLGTLLLREIRCKNVYLNFVDYENVSLSKSCLCTWKNLNSILGFKKFRHKF